MSEKLIHCRAFTRVRPFTEEELRVPPADCPIAREILRWDGGESLTVLDHTNRFQARKNGTYRVGPVLWSFVDEEVPEVKPATQADVYSRVVAPVIPQIVDGYSTAFLVAGGASSGRLYTMYGDGVDTPNRGIVCRFAEDIFQALEKKKEEESEMTCEMQAIDINNEAYVDCLATAKKGAKESELKLVSSPEGPKLQGATTVEVSGSLDFKNHLRKFFQTVGKRNSTHTISLRFTETFEFSDPENHGQSVRKSRRFRVLFALLRNVPAAFQRCVQVAVEHDSGENPLAKVPVREAAFTRLYPEVLQQGYALNVIACVSPFFEHVKENLNTLTFCTKVQQLIAKPKKQQDASLLEMRRLADEVKDLKTEVRKQNESMNIVQQELNAREMELMKQEEAYERAKENLKLAKEDLQIAIIGRNYQVDKSRRARRCIQMEMEAEKRAIHDLQKKIDKRNDENAGALKSIKDTEERAAALERRIEKEQRNEAEFRARLSVFLAEEKKIQAMEDFNVAAPAEQERIVREGGLGTETENRELQRQHELSSAMEKEVAESRAAYEQVLEKERGGEEKETLKKEIAKLQAEMAATEKKLAEQANAADRRAGDSKPSDQKAEIKKDKGGLCPGPGVESGPPRFRPPFKSKSPYIKAVSVVAQAPLYLHRRKRKHASLFYLFIYLFIY
eukprot:gene11070-7701_t